MTLTVQTQDVTEIARDLYPRTPEALSTLLDELREVGYVVKDLRESEWRKKDGIPVEQMEARGWSLWLAKLEDIRFGKCDSCGAYISTTGIRSHGHQCEKCGVVTYRHIVDGSIVRFQFLDDEHGPARCKLWGSKLRLKAQRWDIEKGWLYLYAHPLEGGGLSIVSGDAAWDLLDRYRGKKWEIVHDDIIRVRHKQEWNHSTADIEMCDVHGHEWNHKIVRLWKGEEYGEYGRFPIPETISIYEPWHWMPLEPSPTLHEKLIHAVHMVSDQGYYYQDGRAVFNRHHFDGMALFVEHFTTLDATKFRQASRHFRLDGPGAIEDIAMACWGDSAVVCNKPNIGNVLVGLGKAIEGKSMTEREIATFADGLKTKEAQEFLSDLFTKGKAPKVPADAT